MNSFIPPTNIYLVFMWASLFGFAFRLMFRAQVVKNTTRTDRSPPLQDRGTKDYNTGAEGRHLTHMKASRNMTQRKWHVSCLYRWTGITYKGKGINGLQREGKLCAKKQGCEKVVLGGANSDSKVEHRMCAVMMVGDEGGWRTW